MSKVFEVVTEHMIEDSAEIRTSVQYVTADGDSLQLVADYFTVHCEQYGFDLISIKKVLTIVQHIKEEEK